MQQNIKNYKDKGWKKNRKINISPTRDTQA